jgi:hypothetical protein
VSGLSSRASNSGPLPAGQRKAKESATHAVTAPRVPFCSEAGSKAIKLSEDTYYAESTQP